MFKGGISHKNQLPDYQSYSMHVPRYCESHIFHYNSIFNWLFNSFETGSDTTIYFRK